MPRGGAQRGKTETAIFCARTNTLVYVVYLNSRKKQDVTAHLKVAYNLNAGDANDTYKLYFGGSGASATMRPNIYFHERRPTEVELRACSDLRAQRGQPRVVPFETTTKPRGFTAAVKATNKTARNLELSTPANRGKRKALWDLGFHKNGVLIVDEFSDGRSKVASQCSFSNILSQYAVDGSQLGP